MITQHPVDTIEEVGETVTLSIVAGSPDGGVISYQWLKSTSEEKFVSIPLATNSTFVIESVTIDDDNTKYKCRVTNTINGKSKSVDSNIAVVTIA